jgi:hypothetical protein
LQTKSGLLKTEEVPPIAKIEALLYHMTKETLKGTKQSPYDIVYPPMAPPETNLDLLAGMVKIRVQDTSVNDACLEQVQAQVLVKILLADKKRTYRRGSPVQLLSHSDISTATFYTKEIPAFNGKTSGSWPVLWAPQLKPVHITRNAGLHAHQQRSHRLQSDQSQSRH